ncbi:type III secretion system translocon subunit SctE [Yersinia bercovieri]|uniref:type III secretion system translocon subunit SctE n=1 Tax=Yersinia bercovieri TaxID=634 RepID=UPI0011AB391D|nr:type III secretion system translocon subunit SctE [Yersinia bercovieri]
MVNVTQSGSERINNIRAFTQGVNVNQVRDESTKNLLALEDACRELASSEQERRHRREGDPMLAAPKMTFAKAYSLRLANASPADKTASRPEKASQKSGQTSSPNAPDSFNASAMLFASMAELRQILHSNSLNEIRGRLQLINAESTALREQGDKLLSVLEKDLGELQTAKDKVDNIYQALQQGKDTVQDLAQQQLELETKLSNNKLIPDSNTQIPDSNTQIPDSSSTLTPNNSSKQTPDSSNTLTAGKLTPEQEALLQADLTALEIKLADAKLNVVTLEQNYTQALTQATNIAQQADKSRNEINKFIESAPHSPQIEDERWESSLALLTLLTAQLKKALNDDSIKNMRQQQEVMEAINEASRKDSEKKAKEAEEAQRKADEANKAASCASKVFGYIMLAVSVLATVASLGTAGPLTLAIAAIGIAMTVADIVLEETGNSSLMGMLAAKISTGITDMLIAFGVPEDQAKEIGGILGMILAAVVFLVISLGSISSFFKNGLNAIGNVLKSAVKALPRTLTNAAAKVGTKATKLSEPLAKFAGKGGEVARKAEIGLNAANATLGVTNAAVSGGLNLHASAMIRDMKELLADMLRNNTAIQMIDELLKALISNMSKGYDQINEMFEGMLTALNESGHAKANMMKSSFA